MAISRHPLIAREGNIPLGVVLLAGAVLVFIYPPGAVVAGLLSILLAWLYRDPNRCIPSAPLGLVSPVDGRVVEITEARDPFLERTATRIRIRMSRTGVFSVRSLTEGKVVNQWLGNLPTGTEVRRGLAVWVQTDEGDDVVTVLQLNRVRHRLSCYLSSGQRIGQGQRCGFYLFGGLVEAWLPANVRLDVNPGDRVLAGADLIAQLQHA